MALGPAYAAGPQVQIAVGRSYEAPASFFVSAEVAGDSAVQWLALSMNGTELIRVNDASLEYEVRNLPAGTYNFTATARDYSGRSGSTTKQVEVVAANQPPTVSLSLPGGTQYSAPASIALAAQYADSDGSVKKIEYFANDVWVGNSITAPFTAQWSNVAPGQYQLVAWAYDDKGIGAGSAPVTVFVGTAEAEFVDQSVPAKMIPGMAYPVTVRMKNTGTVVWRASERYRLGSQNPGDNHTWGLHRVELAADVAPGQVANFTFNATAPTTVGVYDFQWRMLQEGVRWFGANTVNQSIQVSIPPAQDAQFVSQSVPGQMSVGAMYVVNVKFRNAGTSTWRKSDQYKLGSQNPQDNGTWNVARVELASDVAPGQVASFDFSVKAPVSPGGYNFQWRMLQEGVAWFGELTPNQTVQTITPPPSPMLGIATVYDTLGRVISVRQDSELGVLTTDTVYSGLGTVVKNPRGSQTSTSFQAFGAPGYDLPVSIQAPENVVVEIQRDVFGKPIVFRRRDGSGSLSVERAYVYDAHQRICKSVEPEVGATVTDYDLSGNVAWAAAGLALPARGDCNRSEAAASTRRVERTYDDRNRLRALTFPDGQGNQIWSYYPDGAVKEVVTENEGVSLGRVINRYAYNKRRLLVSESVEQPGSYVWATGYAYDTLGGLRALTYPTQLTVDFAPNAFGLPTQVASVGQVYASGVNYYPNGAIARFAYGNGIVHAMTQNARQLPARSLDVGAMDLRTGYDANGNVTAIVDGLRGENFNRAMSYDGLDRLVSAVSCSFGGDCQHRFTYDALDNIKTWTLGGVKDHRYYYDGRNQLTNIRNQNDDAIVGLGYDDQGNLENKNGQAYDFDYGNRLREVRDKEKYRYDAQGRRVQATREGGALGLSHYSQTGQLLYTEDLSAAGKKGWEHIYLGGSLIAKRQSGGAGAAVAVRYQHTDALGSPVAVSDAAGAVIERTEWEPYGTAIGKPDYNGVGYAGHLMDGATGLAYMQQRYYDPAIGRFLSVDPVTADGDTGGNFNRYKYAANSPYSFKDPDGRQECRPCDQLSDAVASEGFFVGRQLADAGSERQRYTTEAAKLDPKDSAGRSQLKAEARSRTPSILRAMIETKRPSTEAKAGSGGRANVSNPKVNRVAANMKIAGRGALIVAAVQQGIEIANSPEPARDVAGAGGMVVGAIALGELGALGGGLVGSLFPGPGTAIGVGVGGLAGAGFGGHYGELGAEALYDRVNGE